MTGATVSVALVMLALERRTWDFYKGDVYARYKNKEVVASVGEEVKRENLQ